MNKPPIHKGVKGRMAKEEYVFCMACGQKFENTEERDTHERICLPLGFTWTPRPQNLEQGGTDGN